MVDILYQIRIISGSGNYPLHV